MAKDPSRKAVALTYDRESDTAPRVAAKGQGQVALKIIELAEKHGIPVKNDPDLMEVLSTLEINQEIPENIYVAVAELLAFVYGMNQKKGAGTGGQS
ncbi:MAG TPA: EscU/YscU/HrcU family type III secretion system export apparatus switch protein [Desulfotignum sp.]|nr:EscU/YscU/HrcU family type III secretion system export apparatus switch protein [Desulfotignum sp.]